jgi:predicted GNAT family N-acyltransferase
MKPLSPYTVALTDWQTDGEALSQVRFTVFVREQGVPPEIEMDELDADQARCRHVVARDASGQVIGTGRLILDKPVPRIGRMAVLKSWRGGGVGAALLETLCAEARHLGYTQVLLHAQSHATPFYYGQGFLSQGAEFVEAGIPHQEMRRTL